MASRSPPPLSAPNSPAASLLIETIDPRTGEALAQYVDQTTHGLLTAVSPLPPSLSDHLHQVDIPCDFAALAQSLEDLSLDPSRTASSATTNHTVTPHNLAGPAQSESGQPPQNPHAAIFPAMTDRIDIPHNPNGPAQPARRQRPGHRRPAILPTVINYEEQHPFGILNSIHLRMQIGRDTSGNPNMMPPAPPARVVQRNDFNWNPPNGDPKDSIIPTSFTTKTTAPAKSATRQEHNFLGNAMKQTYPPKLDGVAEARLKSEGKKSEDLVGLGANLEAAVLAKREYNDMFGAFRTRWTEVQLALAAKAKKMHGSASASELRPVVGAIGTIGTMFALGKAVDIAAFPGWSFGEFDERACSPEGYLSELFPELTHRPSAGPAGRLGQAAGAAPVPSPQWNFSLGRIMPGEKRNRLLSLWAAAAAGQWEAVDEMTSGMLAAAEKLLGRV